MGDAERDIFWTGTAIQSLLMSAQDGGIVKGRGAMLEIVGEIIATYTRLSITGSLLTDAQSWATRFRDTYSQGESIREDEKGQFIRICESWRSELLDIMKERYSQPREIYDMIPKIDVIYDAITQLQTTENQFLGTSPSAREIKEKASQVIDSTSNQDILLTGYFDSALLDKLLSALRRGVAVKLVVPPYSGRDRDNASATRRLKNAGAEVKEHPSNHSRLLIIGDRSAMVSSADPKTDSLDQNYEAGIWTTNRTLVQRGRNFFEAIWTEAADWESST